ncbi:MAG: MOSC domain-containing protein [Lysobacter sp.]|nr:MOSC domain-containing protein [Lysobacter sp.]
MRLSALSLHPLKSSAALPVASLEIEPRGPRFDRRWLAVDAEGRFVTARAVSELVLVRAEPLGAGLRLSAPGMASLDVAVPPADASRIPVTVWKNTIDALRADSAADAWLSAFLQREVRLVHMDDAACRAVDPAYGRDGDEVSFADGYPLLVISQAALEGLNARLAEAGRPPVTMAHFRPNLVVDGVDAHAEDGWRRVRIGGIDFDAVKPCTRCVFTTVDPALGCRREDGQPLEILKGYRRTPAGITFGMNLIARGTGTLRVGDAVEALD